MSTRSIHPDVIAYQVSHPDFSVNTIASLRALINQGIRHFMFDVQACKDGQLVLIHQLTFPSAKGEAFVQYASLKEISEVDFGAGQRVLTLSDALEFIPEDSEVALRIVGRHSLYPLINFLNENSHVIPKRLWFVSGDQLMLHTLSNKFKRAKCASLMSGLPLHDLNVLIPHGIHAVVVSPQEINAHLVHELNGLGLDLWVQDVSACGLYKRCLDWSAKKVLSHQPALLSEFKLRCNTSDLLTH